MSADQGKGALSIQTTSNDGAVIIRIRDTGPGIPVSVQKKLFQPFCTTKADGSGLGLNISQKIIREHGGNITFENLPKRGCVFSICLPLAEPDFPEFEPVLKSADKALQALNIMVVDDEAVILDLQYHLLSQLGHKATLFKSASEALAALDHHHFDLILSDMKMPRMNGKQFYAHLEKHHPHMIKKIIFVTGDTLSKTNTAFYKMQHLNLLYKPFILKQLEETIQQALDSSIHSIKPLVQQKADI